MTIMSEHSRDPSARLYFISRAHAIYAAVVVAAKQAKIAVPRDVVGYDPQQHPHWDFLVRCARRQALCASSRSVRECIEEVTTMARLYMDNVICEERL
jgi:hypothetical protein